MMHDPDSGSSSLSPHHRNHRGDHRRREKPERGDHDQHLNQRRTSAVSAEITQQNDSPAFVLRSSSATHRVTYLAGKGEVTRSETDGDKVLRTETYRLPDWTVRFEASSASAEQPQSLSVNQTVQMICRRPNAPRPTPKTSVPLREDSQLAVIGRDHRFEKPIVETKSPE